MSDRSFPPVKSIPFIDLGAQRRALGGRIEARMQAIVESGQFIMGPEVAELERKLADFCAMSHALSCANGTDALALPLMAWGLGAGDAVFCPSFTFAATAEIIPWFGAEPVFVDIDPVTYNMDATHLEASIQQVIAEGRLTPRVVIGVDLFGQLADYPALSAIARRYGLKLIADSAQSFGATLHGEHPGRWVDVVTTSFYPAKPLGCYGDGGAVLTSDDALHDLMDSLRIHGKASAADLAGHDFGHEAKYLNMRVGINSRLDTLQAGILLEKLTIFEDELEKRQIVADIYAQGLANVVRVPTLLPGATSSWAQYTIESPDRDGLGAYLKRLGIPTASYYPLPMHKQPPYQNFGLGPGGLPVSEEKAKSVISLPMHPYLDRAMQDEIMAAIRAFH